MATRLYLSTSEVPPISPPYDNEWDLTLSAERFLMTTEKTGTPWVHKTDWKPGGTFQDKDILIFQFVSPPITQAITIGGQVKGQIWGYTNNPLSRARTQLIVRLVNSSGSTVAGGVIYGGDLESGNTLPANRLVVSSETATTISDAPIVRASPVDLLSVDANVGDRIVVEMGMRMATASTTTAYSVGIGVSDAYETDLPEMLGFTTDTAYNTWVEFSQDLPFIALNENHKIMIGGSLVNADLSPGVEGRYLMINGTLQQIR